ncbi:uracil phosphoribosyltransferase domain-containing protein [Ditylenchus destructor]|nr:uracil phosphoribosyltransferase domain-containing protein [Ditylenchus destructor]
MKIPSLLNLSDRSGSNQICIKNKICIKVQVLAPVSDLLRPSYSTESRKRFQASHPGKENGTNSSRDQASASEASKGSGQGEPESLAKATLSPKSNREVQEKSSKEKHVTICLDPVIGRSARVEPYSRDPTDDNRKQSSERSISCACHKNSGERDIPSGGMAQSENGEKTQENGEKEQMDSGNGSDGVCRSGSDEAVPAQHQRNAQKRTKTGGSVRSAKGAARKRTCMCDSSSEAAAAVPDEQSTATKAGTPTGSHSAKAAAAASRRGRTISGSKSEDHFMTTESGRKVYTKGRPPWYDRAGKMLKKSYLIGICGGSASGKTTVAQSIIERLEMPWVTVLSMDSFYKVLNAEQHELAAKQEYNFDHPDAFDFELLYETLVRLRDGKSVEVPVYDFTTHRRDKNPKLMYGADILIFEGILSFHRPEIAVLMDMKVFVDTDSDIRLVRRLERDISQRGRDVTGVLDQYLKFVKPAFDTFIAPATKLADIIVPRGGENHIAIDLIVRQIKNQLVERGYEASKASQYRQEMAQLSQIPANYPETLHIVKQTTQIRGIHTIIRNKETNRDEFIFHAERLMCLLIEDALNFVPYFNVEVDSPTGQKYRGCKKCSNICGVSIMRAGDTLAKSLRSVIRDCKMGKILIQTNEESMEPELHYLRLPKDISKYKVLLMDATVATGAAAMMAIRILLDHDVKEENIILLSLLMAETGVHRLAYAFPKLTLVTTAVDPHISEQYYVIPGLGNFGDRYFGSEAVAHTLTDDEDDLDGPLLTDGDVLFTDTDGEEFGEDDDEVYRPSPEKEPVKKPQTPAKMNSAIHSSPATMAVVAPLVNASTT